MFRSMWNAMMSVGKFTVLYVILGPITITLYLIKWLFTSRK